MTDLQTLTIEQLIDEAHARGLRVNNIFEFKDGWRSNVRRGEAGMEFGDGATAAESLANAILKAAPEPVASLEDLLG
ncbi:hypothetical protein [Rhodoligotrophos defluvii]|uniref:hypothetical protein n=1 Tax=Rhodoligotrophos defluvii TaxID=2561934 RepID=UPI0010CA0E11|nr:hypothetical protein [Rhodoligotrophos defluvii]